MFWRDVLVFKLPRFANFDQHVASERSGRTCFDNFKILAKESADNTVTIALPLPQYIRRRPELGYTENVFVKRPLFLKINFLS